MQQPEPGSGGLGPSALGPSALGQLSHLTSLAVRNFAVATATLEVGWVPPGGGGPRLRWLKPANSYPAPASATPAALERLETLRLAGVAGCGGLMDALPELSHLTALAIESPIVERIELDGALLDPALQLVVGALSAPALRELHLGRFQCIFSFTVFGSLPEHCLGALNALSLCYAIGPKLLPGVLCAAMSALRRLDVCG